MNIHIIRSAAVFLIVVFLFWIGGVEIFDRGHLTGIVYFLSIMCGCFAYSESTLHEEQAKGEGNEVR